MRAKQYREKKERELSGEEYQNFLIKYRQDVDGGVTFNLGLGGFFLALFTVVLLMGVPFHISGFLLFLFGMGMINAQFIRSELVTYDDETTYFDGLDGITATLGLMFIVACAWGLIWMIGVIPTLVTPESAAAMPDYFARFVKMFLALATAGNAALGVVGLLISSWFAYRWVKRDADTKKKKKNRPLPNAELASVDVGDRTMMYDEAGALHVLDDEGRDVTDKVLESWRERLWNEQQAQDH